MAEIKDIVAKVRDLHLEYTAIDFDDAVERMAKNCQSPIEVALGSAFVFKAHWEENAEFLFEYRVPLHFDGLIRNGDYRPTGVGFYLAIYEQVNVGKYILDFYLEAFFEDSRKKMLAIAVECDGHDFHERTKEQAIRDKKRDRWLQSRGIGVMRFTGSEIWKDPIACAEQVIDAFWSSWRRHCSRE